MSSAPPPPEDPERKKIIDKLAQFVARNGPEFENMTKQKQANNPQFGFLFGGPEYNYYQYRVTTEQIIMKSHAQKGPPSDPNMQARLAQLQTLEKELQTKTLSVAEQIKQSEQNLQAHEKAIVSRRQAEVEEEIVATRSQRVNESAEECEIDLDELDGVLIPLRNSCTKDAIQNAKYWVLTHIVDSACSEFFSQFLINRVFTSDTTFESRLHLAYLLNDIMHHCARKPADSLKRCVENVVVPIFSLTASQAAEEQMPKLNKLLGIWEQHKYFISEVLESLRSPLEAYQRYQADLATKYADVVNQVTQSGQEKLQSLHQQHQEFCNHLNNELKGLQKQYELEKQAVNRPPPVSQANLPPPPGGFNGPPPGFNQSLPPGDGFGGLPPSNLPYNPSQPPPAFNTALPPPGGPSGAGPPTDFSLPPGAPHTDFSAPPPGMQGPPPNLQAPPPGMTHKSADLIPSAPYYKLPAGLLVTLVKTEDCMYRPIDPADIRLPPPEPPTEKLLAAIESFYKPPSHESPVDAEGWENMGLYEYYEVKKKARQSAEEDLALKRREEKRFKEVKVKRDRSATPERRGRDRPPRGRRPSLERPRDRYDSRGRSRTPDRPAARRERSRERRRRSRSPSPRRPRRRSRSESPRHRRSRSRSRSHTPPRRGIDRRSPTPDDMPVLGMFPPPGVEVPLGQENKGAQLLMKMGWGGAGLGATEQGIVDPIKAAEVRTASDLYKGIGSNTDDPFEQFRKNRGSVFVEKLRTRDEKLLEARKRNSAKKRGAGS